MISFFKKHKFDIILVGSVAILALTFVICFYSFNTEGSYVTVTVNNAKTATYPLNEDGEYKIKNDYGFNILKVKDGYAYIASATCPDKLCIHQGKVRLNGEQLICLPNKTIITVTSKSEPDTDF